MSIAKTKLGPVSIRSRNEISWEMNWIISMAGDTEQE